MYTGRIYCQSTEKAVNYYIMSIITMRSRRFPANSASDCLRFAKFRPQFSNLVARSTDGSAKCLVRYNAHNDLVTDVENSVQIDA